MKEGSGEWMDQGKRKIFLSNDLISLQAMFKL